MNVVHKFPALKTGYAEPKERTPKVAILDSFRADDARPAHGEMVESVMLTHGGLKDEDIQRYHAESGPFISPQDVLEAPDGRLLESYAYFSRGAGASFLNMVSDNLEQVMWEQPSVRVVNQSQSQTPARIAEPFFQAVFEDPQFRERLAARLELPSDSPAPKVASSLLKLTEGILTHDKGVNVAKERYESIAKAAYEKGIVQVIAAGNQGSLSSWLQEQGVESGGQSFRSLLVNDWVTVVGGATADGKISKITSPGAGAEVFALGENVPFRLGGRTLAASGTSLAAPLISSFAVQILEQNPEWGAGQVEARMRGA